MKIHQASDKSGSVYACHWGAGLILGFHELACGRQASRDIEPKSLRDRGGDLLYDQAEMATRQPREIGPMSLRDRGSDVLEPEDAAWMSWAPGSHAATGYPNVLGGRAA